MRLVPITCLLAVAMLGSDPASAASTNVALASAGGVATASANTATQALVNDGNTAAQGWAVLTSASTIKVDWGSSKPVNQVTAIFANANSKTFKFQYWNGSGWVDLSTTYTSNTEITVSYIPRRRYPPLPSASTSPAPQPASTSMSCRRFTSRYGRTNVALASAGGVATASANTATQALVNDGNTAAQGWVVPTTGPRSRWTGARPSR